MAQITITCADADVPTLVAALQWRYGPQGNRTNIQFIRDCIDSTAVQLVREYQKSSALDAALNLPPIQMS